MWAAAPVDAKQPHRGRLRPSGFDLESTAEAIRSIDGELCALGESAPKAACDSPSSSVPPVGALGTAERSALAFQKQIGALKRSGDVTAIMQGFHAHSAHVGVAKAASKALFSLSSSSDEHDERIIGAGGAEHGTHLGPDAVEPGDGGGHAGAGSLHAAERALEHVVRIFRDVVVSIRFVYVFWLPVDHCCHLCCCSLVQPWLCVLHSGDVEALARHCWRRSTARLRAGQHGHNC